MIFKYKRLPNFCYRCGLMEHDLKYFLERRGNNKNGEVGNLQYGAWLRGELMRRIRWEPSYTKKNKGVDTRGWMTDDVDRGIKVSDIDERSGGA